VLGFYEVLLVQLKVLSGSMLLKNSASCAAGCLALAF
jgi:hypothetical protein